jgi:tubulin--tyrosine ligase-like protein 12
MIMLSPAWCLGDTRVCRSIETGPKIASQYLSRPALYKGRKFDLRYIIMVRSLQPLEMYVYRMFWIRAANKPFSLDHLDDYEKHFTVHFTFTCL